MGGKTVWVRDVEVHRRACTRKYENGAGVVRKKKARVQKNFDTKKEHETETVFV